MLTFPTVSLYHRHVDVSNSISLSQTCWRFQQYLYIADILTFPTVSLYHRHVDFSNSISLSQTCWRFQQYLYITDMLTFPTVSLYNRHVCTATELTCLVDNLITSWLHRHIEHILDSILLMSSKSKVTYSKTLLPFFSLQWCFGLLSTGKI